MRSTALALVALAASASSVAPPSRALTLPRALDGLRVAASSFPDARSDYSMTSLPSGRVLVAGGSVSGAVTSSAWLFDPTTGQWSPTGPMATPRRHHGAVLLRDGRVLVMGGGGAGLGAAAGLASAELYDPVSGEWSATGALASSRYYFSATRLRDGRVLVAGGIHPEEVSGSTVYTTIAGVELYDPATRAWSAGEALATARSDHTATLLGDGRVLVVGGRVAAGASVELYDPVFSTWSPRAPLAATRYLHTATLLHDGRVLVAGGTAGAGAISTAVRYDPEADAWTGVGALATGRFAHAASLLPTGEVLVAGGMGPPARATAEAYDPATGGWSAAGTLGAGRGYLKSTVLPDARALVGPGWQGAAAYTAAADLIDLSRPAWSAGTALVGSRRRAAAALLPTGRVLVAGGLDADGTARADAEVIDPGPFGGAAAPLALPSPRASLTLTVLPSGLVLAVGGSDGLQPLSRVDLLDPATGLYSPAPPLAVARAGHTATLLGDGSVLVVGGSDASGVPVAEAERLDPALAGWHAAGTPASARLGHTATRLPTGAVLVVGGVGAGQDELFDPGSSAWTIPATQSGSGRAHHTATLLLDGRVLLAGGTDPGPIATATIWGEAGVVGATAPMSRGRSSHRALLLPSGRVLVAGGAGVAGAESSAEEYDPATAQWRTLPPMAASRDGFTLTLLPDGGALAAGGADGLLATDRYGPGRQEDWPGAPFIANWPTHAVPGLEVGVGVGGLIDAPEAGAGTSGSSNLNHPVFVLLGTEGDGAGIAPRSRWDASHAHFVVPSIGRGLAWLFPVVAGALGGGVPVFVDPPLGRSCTGVAQCAGGPCVDGVCCDTACGGGDPTDCQACAVAAGASVDGRCAPLAPTITCRDATGPCDAAEACDGSGAACPADLRQADGEACGGGGTCEAGICEVPVPTEPAGCSCGSAAAGLEALLPVALAALLPRRRRRSLAPPPA